MLILIFLFLILAIGLISFGLSTSLKEVTIKKTLFFSSDNSSVKRKSKIGLVFSLPFSQKLLELLHLETKIKSRLEAAHLKITPNQFFSFKLLLMLCLAILSIPFFGKFDPMVIFISLGLGYILPEILLTQKIKQRKYRIARLLPETVDLLGLCVEGGLDFVSAVKWIIEKTTPNPLIEELSFVLEEIKWGKPRAQALKDMAKRLNIPEVTSFVQTLVQAERMGTPVSEAFAILSEDTRLQRFHQGERYAMQAPIKILIPLIFCILPVIAIIIGGPIFLQFMQGGLLKGLK
jgi:tight adherence protein C